LDTSLSGTERGCTMRYGIGIMALVLILCLFYPSTANAEQANLKGIRIVVGGKLKERNRIKDIGDFIEITINGEESETLNTKQVLPESGIYVKPGANLKLEYKKQEAWFNYNARAKVSQKDVKIEEGEMYVTKKGGWFNTDKLAFQALSEYYVKVEPDGKTILYVVEGEVRARDETGQERLVLESMAIDESLSRVTLPDEEIRRILMWREQLRRPLRWPARIRNWTRRYWWTVAAVSITTIIVREIISPDLHVVVKLP